MCPARRMIDADADAERQPTSALLGLLVVSFPSAGQNLALNAVQGRSMRRPQWAEFLFFSGFVDIWRRAIPAESLCRRGPLQGLLRRRPMARRRKDHVPVSWVCIKMATADARRSTRPPWTFSSAPVSCSSLSAATR